MAVMACGDNVVPEGPPLRTSDVLTIVAHQDDDLLFMAADLEPRLASRRSVTTVYVTAGDGGNGLRQASARLAAIRAAYGEAAGSQAWECGLIDIAGHAVQHCRLADRDISIVALDLPDGGPDGTTKASLLHLFEATVDHADTIAEHPETYTRDDLVDTLAAIIDTTHPQTVWTLDVAAMHGADHNDHEMVGTLAGLARARAASTAALISYRGYNINEEPAMLPDALAMPFSLPMRAYEACVLGGCGTCGVDACPTLTDPRYFAFVHRHYPVPAQRPRSGWLRGDGGCVTIGDDGAVGVGACDDRSVLAFAPDGRIARGGWCLDVGPLGVVTATQDCTAAPSRELLVDGEGHVWAGIAADSTEITEAMHALCLGEVDGTLVANPCGDLAAPAWRIERPPVTTSHAASALGATGRRVQLADVTGDGRADLCAIVNGVLRCAAGNGDGSFGAAAAIAWPGPIATAMPESLVLGDIDGDGKVDACGVAQNRTMCARNGAAGETAVALPATCIPSSLELADETLCARDANGLHCGSYDSASAAVVSTWPAALVTWTGDLDGDGVADWCAGSAAGPACGLAADRATTTAGLPWGYSLGGAVEAGDGLHALGDVTGDGLADLCSVVGQRVECAPATGRGFGPRVTLLETSAPPQALWLGDLDGDGRVDVCVDTSDAVECALSP